MKRPDRQIENSWLANDRGINWTQRGAWPAYWLKWGGETPEDTISFYRLEFISSEQEVLDFLVSGDNRYKLFLDGKQIASGPETGHLNSYFYNRIQVTTGKGNHTLTAMVFDFKEYASYAHVSLRPGFLLAAADIAMRDRFNTGFAPWEVQSDNSIEWSSFIMLYPVVRFHASRGKANAPWQPAQKAEQAYFAGIRNEYPAERRLMVEGSLPQQIRDSKIIKIGKVFICDPESEKLQPLQNAENMEKDFFNFCNGGGYFTIPSGSSFKAVAVMDNYYCLYPVLQTLGGKGAEITLTFAEACHENKEWLDDIKHNREEIWGKYIRKCYNNADIFYPDSSQFEFFTPHWRCGVLFAFEIKTGSEDLILQKLSLTETRYPLNEETYMFCNDEKLNAILPLCWRTLQMCTHETYMDCPYYEQLMYAGDSRLEALVTMTGTSDDRMVKKMISIFADSQLDSGFLQSRFPCRMTQIIPTFSLMWIGSLYDFANMRNDKVFVKSMMGTLHKIIAAYEERINHAGLLEFFHGWNFMDWVPEWSNSVTANGTPPHAENGVSTVINMLYVYALKMAAELCEYTGTPEISGFYRRRGREVAANIIKHFFNQERGLFTEDAATEHYCEHSQCLALLSGFMPPEIESSLRKNLFNGKTELLQTTIYFSHYYFEVCNLTNRTDAFFNRLQLWSDNIKSGLKTLMERPEPSRSDCHAWSSHPYYHTAATLAGIRPAAFGFAKVRIEPHPGDLTTLHGEMMHPSGKITADYKFSGTAMQCRIELPPEVSGTLIWQNKEYPLKGGINEYNINTAE